MNARQEYVETLKKLGVRILLDGVSQINNAKLEPGFEFIRNYTINPDIAVLPTQQQYNIHKALIIISQLYSLEWYDENSEIFLDQFETPEKKAKASKQWFAQFCFEPGLSEEWNRSDRLKKILKKIKEGDVLAVMESAKYENTKIGKFLKKF
jgi:hypothetical protein